jgi:hypothetical protein
MSASGKRARGSGTAVSPFGSASRLVACPVCSKRVHLLLAASHVESHFSETPGDEGDEGDAAPSTGGGDEGDEPPAGNHDERRCPPGDAEEAARGQEAAAEDEARDGCESDGDGDGDGDGQEALYGGALVGPPADGLPVGTYVPGSDAVWVPFKLQARAPHPCLLDVALRARRGSRLCFSPFPSVLAGDERRPPRLRPVLRSVCAWRA